MSEGQQLVGTTIAGKYCLRRLIGVGGMGAVYEGQHVDLAKKVAVKIIDSGNDPSAELATRFKREARAASAVESDNIVQVFDVGRDPDVGLYMVMELLQGEDLEMRLRKQPGRRLDPVLVAQIGHQVARALVKAHAARVIHRDLKPANIFLTDREDGGLRVKILDFGISKLLASEASIATNKEGLLQLTAAGVALGTPQYMSPEQAQGLTTVDHRTDVWGLGVVMYEALAGIPAYPELGSYQETILRILQSKPKPLASVAPWVPEALAKVVHEAIEHDMAKRIPDCAALARRIGEAVPDVAGGSTGPYDAARALRRQSISEISAVHTGPRALAAPIMPPAVVRPGTPVSPILGAAPPPAVTPSAPEPSTQPKPKRPITLADDTQVVVRPSDPGAVSEESDPSMTMLATESVRSTRRDPPKVVVGGGAEASLDTTDEAPALSTGDPTMFQTPAWVAQPGEGPTTIKSGLALGEAPAAKPGAKPMHGVLAAALTALVVVGVGGAILFLARGGEGTEATGAQPPAPTSVSLVATPAPVPPEPTIPAPSPPSTGTAKAPMAPATGAAYAEEPAVEETPDASAKSASVDATR